MMIMWSDVTEYGETTKFRVCPTKCKLPRRDISRYVNLVACRKLITHSWTQISPPTWYSCVRKNCVCGVHSHELVLVHGQSWWIWHDQIKGLHCRIGLYIQIGLCVGRTVRNEKITCDAACNSSPSALLKMHFVARKIIFGHRDFVFPLQNDSSYSFMQKSHIMIFVENRRNLTRFSRLTISMQILSNFAKTLWYLLLEKILEFIKLLSIP